MSTIQKKIEELRRYADEYDPNINDLSGRAVEGTERVLRNAAETIEQLSAKLTASDLNDGWIPMDECYPGEDGHYIVTARDREGGRYYGIAEYSHWDGWQSNYEIIAWMELPELYKPKESKDEKY